VGVWGVKPQEATKTVKNKNEEIDKNTVLMKLTWDIQPLLMT